MIKKVGNQYLVTSEEGQVLGRHDNEEDAYLQLYAIEKSKQRSGKSPKGKIDLARIAGK